MMEKHPLKVLAERVHKANRNWWIDLDTGERLNRNFGELMMLAVSELAEALEGDRKNLMDDKLPHRRMAEVEIADCMIRLLDVAEGLKMDLAGAFEEKMEFNAERADHKPENRRKENGVKY
jgi:NTP pyrophosphatase (non-canonical NTP hydrolase)